MLDKIVITGYEIITPLGNTIQALWDQLVQNQSALRSYDFLEQEKFRFSKACLVEPIPETYEEDRGWRMVQDCTMKLIQQAGITLPKNTGVFVGSTLGESAQLEVAASREDMNTSNAYADVWARKIRQQFSVNGPAVAYGTACAAGNYAIGQAADYMRHFDLDVAIAGAAEPFSRIAMAGFNRTRAMTNDFCKPFDQNHNGMVLGEGAAFFLLEKLTHAQQRNAKTYAVVEALGLSCDAYHVTTPKPDGSGMKKAMQQALKLAHKEPSDIQWVCAHGSGTLASDDAEVLALQAVFDQHKPYISGYKGATGHTLGAATAIELAICLKGMEEGCIPQSTNLTKASDNADLNFCFENTNGSLETIMNCGYAFGGINSALIISKI